MWEKIFLLLLHSVEAAVTSQCLQGTTLSKAVVSPPLRAGGVLRVPGAASLQQCVAACCDLPGYNLAWMLQGRCYVLSCQGDECRPQHRPGADSFLAFLRTTLPPAPGLQSLVKVGPYTGRLRALSQSSRAPGGLEDLRAPGDLEALEDLDLLDGPLQELSASALEAAYPEGRQQERGESLEGEDRFNQSEGEEGLEGLWTQTRDSLGWKGDGNIWSPTGAAETTNDTRSSVDQKSLTTVSSQRDHISTSPPTPAPPHRPFQPDVLQVLQSAVRAPLNSTHQPGRPLTSDPTTTTTTLRPGRSLSSDPTTNPPGRPLTSDPTSRPPGRSLNCSHAPSTDPPTADSEVGRSNRGPVAVVGRDRKLRLPVSSLLLDGGGSSGGGGGVGIESYRWEAVSGPPGVRLEGADRAVATATGIRAGRYTFRLTVSDQQGATDTASLSVRVHEAPSPPPVAHASGSHTVSLPNSSLVLRGSVTDGDQTEVHYLWVRDSQSPAAGDVLYRSETQASLYLSNLVEGTYLFQLRVTDAQGRSSTSTSTVEVRPEPGGVEEVELEMLVSVSQVSVAQRDTVVRQLAALIHVLDSDVQVRALQGHSHLSTVLRFSVLGPSEPISGSRLVVLLRNQLLGEKSDYLLFRVLRVDTVLCLLRCSGRGRCDPITKECACDPFWTENLVRLYLGDGESNCEWRVLYVILSGFLLMVSILSLSWIFICCCRRRRQTKVRKKSKYTILDNMDAQERMELRPKINIKHRSTAQNSSLMMSESELDSDQDSPFSRDRDAFS
ncbi:dyslexia-associated protein KIAA0319 homolog isoform X2 [Pungitius pungitius]|uniref:dyslexia-associated protein KIAA0319 homolog isoform X2 n=1 Tax=Pungitius pungitius TaxID=134920 RepID=UPI002E127313